MLVKDIMTSTMLMNSILTPSDASKILASVSVRFSGPHKMSEMSSGRGSYGSDALFHDSPPIMDMFLHKTKQTKLLISSRRNRLTFEVLLINYI